MDIILVREILEFIAKNREPEGQFMSLCIKGYTDDDIQYHARLCYQAGLFEKLKGPDTIYPIELTLEGHRKLAELRDNDPRDCRL